MKPERIIPAARPRVRRIDGPAIAEFLPALTICPGILVAVSGGSVIAVAMLMAAGMTAAIVNVLHRI